MTEKEKQIEFKLIHNDNIPVLVSVRIHNISCYAIVDTGAQMSFIDETFVKVVGLNTENATDIDIASWNSTDDTSIKICNTDISLKDTDGNSYDIPFSGGTLDMKALQETFYEKGYDNVLMILGADWLKKSKAKINVQEKTMHIRLNFITA